MGSQEAAANQGGALMQVMYQGLQCGVHTVDESCVRQVNCKVLLWQCCSLGGGGLVV
jgi:hypothetical protein